MTLLMLSGRAATLVLAGFSAAFLVSGDAARADMRCDVVAIRSNGIELEPTRTEATRRYKGRACGAALATCEQRLERMRYESGGLMPYAACEVKGVTSVQGPEPFLRETADSQCNFTACESAYRSFRRTDCTYQPYQGPRRLCTK